MLLNSYLLYIACDIVNVLNIVKWIDIFYILYVCYIAIFLLGYRLKLTEKGLTAVNMWGHLSHHDTSVKDFKGSVSDSFVKIYRALTLYSHRNQS